MFTDEKWWDLVGPASYKYVTTTYNESTVPRTLLIKVKVLEAWDAIPLESFRELIRSYRIRLE